MPYDSPAYAKLNEENFTVAEIRERALINTHSIKILEHPFIWNKLTPEMLEELDLFNDDFSNIMKYSLDLSKKLIDKCPKFLLQALKNKKTEGLIALFKKYTDEELQNLLGPLLKHAPELFDYVGTERKRNLDFVIWAKKINGDICKHLSYDDLEILCSEALKPNIEKEKLNDLTDLIRDSSVFIVSNVKFNIAKENPISQARKHILKILFNTNPEYFGQFLFYQHTEYFAYQATFSNGKFDIVDNYIKLNEEQSNSWTELQSFIQEIIQENPTYLGTYCTYIKSYFLKGCEQSYSRNDVRYEADDWLILQKALLPVIEKYPKELLPRYAEHFVLSLDYLKKICLFHIFGEEHMEM